MNPFQEVFNRLFHKKTEEELWLEAVGKDYDNRVIRKLPIKDYEKGAGYYLNLGMVFGHSPLEKNAKVEWQMTSGKTGYWKLLDYKRFSDPYDMVESSDWQFLGYKGEKLIEDMSFEEYVQFCKENNAKEKP